MATKYFSRCAGEIVELAQVGYAVRYGEFDGKMYEGQTCVVSDLMGSKMNSIQIDKVRFLLAKFAWGTCSKCGKKHMADRCISRPTAPSNHVCSARCRSAKGPNCECACGGKFHGSM